MTDYDNFDKIASISIEDQLNFVCRFGRTPTCQEDVDELHKVMELEKLEAEKKKEKKTVDYKIHFIDDKYLFISIEKSRNDSFIRWLSSDNEDRYGYGSIVKWDKYYINKSNITFVEEC